MGRPVVPPVERVCEWCERPFLAKRHTRKRFCGRSCAASNLATNRDFSGPANPRFNNGWSVAAGRTVVTSRDGSYVAWYRILLHDQLGRPLESHEIVHHKNGDRADDRLENLQIVTRAEHINMHRDELLAARRTRAAA